MSEALRELIAKWRKKAAKDWADNVELNARLQRGETVTITATAGGSHVDQRETCADELEAALAVNQPEQARNLILEEAAKTAEQWMNERWIGSCADAIRGMMGQSERSQ